MKNAMFYEGMWVKKDTEAFALYEAAQKLSGKEKTAATNKFKQHMKDVELKYKELMTRYDNK